MVVLFGQFLFCGLILRRLPVDVPARMLSRKSENIDLRSFSLNIPQLCEETAVSMLDSLQYANIVAPQFISELPVCSSYVKYENEKSSNTIPIILLHGFDSSCLEYRRLAPALASSLSQLGGGPIYVPDILGWGFGDYNNVKTFSPHAKMVHLKCFLEQVVGLGVRSQPGMQSDGTADRCILVGASLGGAIAVNLAAEVCPELIDKVILIDAQVWNVRCTLVHTQTCT